MNFVAKTDWMSCDLSHSKARDVTERIIFPPSVTDMCLRTEEIKHNEKVCQEWFRQQPRLHCSSCLQSGLTKQLLLAGKGGGGLGPTQSAFTTLVINI